MPNSGRGAGVTGVNKKQKNKTTTNNNKKTTYFYDVSVIKELCVILSQV